MIFLMLLCVISFLLLTNFYEMTYSLTYYITFSVRGKASIESIAHYKLITALCTYYLYFMFEYITPINYLSE